MTDDKTLIKYFSDGQLPTGDHFRDLIESKVNIADFERHTKAFETWKSQGTLQIGSEETGWKLSSGSKKSIALRPFDEDAPPMGSSVALFGWVQADGRIGTLKGPDAFKGEKRQLQDTHLAELPSDGAWHTLIEMPDRPAALELTLATDMPPPDPVGILKRLWRLFSGYRAPHNQVIHATATAGGKGCKPNLRSVGDVEAGKIFLTLALHAVILGALAIALAKQGDFPSLKSYIAYATVLWLSIRIGVRSWSGLKNRMALKWKRQKLLPGPNQTWKLSVKTPHNKSDPAAKVRFHITALWG